MDVFTTGYISKKLNISVRTLRYYDQIGLVTPSTKEDSGKRLYTEDDVFQLEKVGLLKKLKLPLKEIQHVLHHMTTLQVLELHHQALQEKLQNLQSSINQTNQLRNSIEVEGGIDWELLLPLIRSHDSENRKEVWSEFFQQDEQDLLEETMPKMNEDHALTKKWIQIIKRIELCLEEEKSPESKEAQLLAEDTVILSDEMFQGNKELEKKFWEARTSQETSESLGFYPIAEEVLVFLERAIEIYEANVHLSSSNPT